MQRFKPSEDLEQKFIDCVDPLMTGLSAEKTAFLAGAYTCQPLGALLYDEMRAPLANAIQRDAFLESFSELFAAFQFAGNFEGYLSVFRKIFGDDCDVEFVVPGPGQLEINIVATGYALYDFIAAEIVDEEYEYNEIIDDDGDNIAFTLIKGFDSQSDLERLLYEMVPAGIYTTFTLDIG